MEVMENDQDIILRAIVIDTDKQVMANQSDIVEEPKIYQDLTEDVGRENVGALGPVSLQADVASISP